MPLTLGTTFANVTSVVALVVALGGASYAAASLPKDSVTSKQVKNGSLKAADFKAGSLPAGPRGPAGAPGPAGTTGQPGPAGPSATSPLASGASTSGTYGAGVTTTAGAEYYSSEQFPIPLAAPLDATHVVYANSTSAQCPGVGQAAPGYLCLYPSIANNSAARTSFNIYKLGPGAGGAGAGQYGFGLLMKANNAGVSTTQGVWTVTAP